MQGRASTVVGVLVALLCVAWVFVPLRCYARLKVVRNLAIEDWLMVVALVSIHLNISKSMPYS